MIEPIYIINSHASYAEPLDRLLESMKGISNSRKMVFVAAPGCVPGLRERDGIIFHYTEHNSFDYTGLIELAKNWSLLGGWRTHFFCLQDTMEFGPRTDEMISMMASAHPDKWATAVFGGQCNLVLYKESYIITQAPFILSMMNCSKQRSIEMEGALWKHCPEKHRGSFDSGIDIRSDVKSPYRSNVPRIREHYYGVDIVKWKANWGQNMHAMETKP